MSGPSDLESLVRGYRPGGDEWSCELALEALGNERPMWPRSEFDPGHFTASGFVLSPDRDSLLIVHHAKLGRWLQPGGHIESDDATVEAAARREVLEETGVHNLQVVGTTPIRIDAHGIPEHGSTPAHMHIDLGIGYLAGSREIGPLEEVIDARWVLLDELDTFEVDDAVRSGAQAVRCALG
jgi:8-oxo-dGTP pyrophosphatase MutT (NUDIX family)